MKRQLVLASHQKDLIYNSGSGFSNLNSWETLDIFDYESTNTNAPTYFYDPENRKLYLRERGTYRIDYYAQIETDQETSIFYKIRFVIDGVAQDTEYTLHTDDDQQFTQKIEVYDPIDIVFEIYAISDIDLVIRSKNGNDILLITKEL